jgi:hypothetical protein
VEEEKMPDYKWEADTKIYQSDNYSDPKKKFELLGKIVKSRNSDDVTIIVGMAPTEIQLGGRYSMSYEEFNQNFTFLYDEDKKKWETFFIPVLAKHLLSEIDIPSSIDL